MKLKSLLQGTSELIGVSQIGSFRFGARTTWAEARYRVPTLMLFLALVGMVAGCGRGPQISRYKVPREVTETSTPVSDDQMLVGIGLHDDTAWFFKLVGGETEIPEVREDFLAFLESIQFSEEGSSVPEWEVPSDWKRLPGNSFRFATYGIPVGEETLEVAVSNLAFQGPLSDYLLINVNRWRREMGMGPLETPVEESLTQIEKEVGSLYLLELQGAFSGGAMRSGPFANQGGAAPTMGQPPQNSGPKNNVEYALPEGWEDAEQTRDSQVSIAKKAGEQNAIITVTGLGLGAGDWSANVTRWRRQLGLPPLDGSSLAANTETIQVDEVEGQLIRLPAKDDPQQSDQAITAVMLTKLGQVWFVRFSGDRQLVADEEEAFQALLKSLQFTTNEK